MTKVLGPGRTHGTSSTYVAGCRCAPCGDAMREYQRAYKAKNREKVAAYQRAYEVAHRERINETHRAWKAANRDKVLAWARDYYQRTREQQAEQKRQYYIDNRERISARVRQWQEANRVLRLIHAHDHRARKKRAETKVFTKRDWYRMVERQRGCCFYCGERRTLTQDHVIPLWRGGRHSVGNIVAACGSCNSRKNTKFLIEWSGRPRAATASSRSPLP